MWVSDKDSSGETTELFCCGADAKKGPLKPGYLPHKVKALIFAFLVSLMAGASPAVAAEEPTYPADATYIGSEVCMECHVEQAETFSKTLMGRIFINNPRSPREQLGCEGCHGPGSLHVAEGGGQGVGGIVGFRKDSEYPVEARNAICLSCHESGQRTHWRGSTHQARKLACTNCHLIKKKVSPENQFVKATEMETCFQCHKQKRAQMQRSSHMPLREGKMTCSDCHNPHGTFTDKLLKAASVNETCYTCHAEKRGPLLWEHAPVRENCSNCHRPHGSNNKNLLKMRPVRLCQQCHAESGHPSSQSSPTSRFAFSRGCVNCHSQIHGSNHPAGMRLQR